MERKGLGRGLSALLADVATIDESPSAGLPTRNGAGRNVVPIDRIRANPDQPRRAFDEKELEDLAASIREKGVIQPLILRPHPVEAGQYEIVAGERRWRAAQMAAVHELPAVVREGMELIQVDSLEEVLTAALLPKEQSGPVSVQVA